ncbi:MAG: hypothetical protein K2Z81_24770 [Cyanobacteria bacterium]|nr:hypothetical protein [Cyanobacteriota bacterium]
MQKVKLSRSQIRLGVVALGSYAQHVQKELRDRRSRVTYMVTPQRNWGSVSKECRGRHEILYTMRLSDWAKLGERIRWTYIGLRSVLPELYREASELFNDFREIHDHGFVVNPLTDEAWITDNGIRIAYQGRTAIGEWAKLGREVEAGLAVALAEARKWNLAQSVSELRETMVRFGIINKPGSRKSRYVWTGPKS